MTWFMQKYIDESTKTEPMVTFAEIEKRCDEWSRTFHWNVEFSSDTSGMNSVRINGHLIYCFDTEAYAKDPVRIIDRVDAAVRSQLKC